MPANVNLLRKIQVIKVDSQTTLQHFKAVAGNNGFEISGENLQFSLQDGNLQIYQNNQLKAVIEEYQSVFDSVPQLTSNNTYSALNAPEIPVFEDALHQNVIETEVASVASGTMNSAVVLGSTAVVVGGGVAIGVSAGKSSSKDSTQAAASEPPAEPAVSTDPATTEPTTEPAVTEPTTTTPAETDSTTPADPASPATGTDTPVNPTPTENTSPAVEETPTSPEQPVSETPESEAPTTETTPEETPPAADPESIVSEQADDPAQHTGSTTAIASAANSTEPLPYFISVLNDYREGYLSNPAKWKGVGQPLNITYSFATVAKEMKSSGEVTLTGFQQFSARQQADITEALKVYGKYSNVHFTLMNGTATSNANSDIIFYLDDLTEGGRQQTPPGAMGYAYFGSNVHILSTAYGADDAFSKDKPYVLYQTRAVKLRPSGRRYKAQTA
ncbi:hypothetical protein ACFFHK_09570 [Gallibacterium trehalosifermentans]|uniref:Uncharacterized protein n=1 Tax=Gallibacterium trehalosifermentans TaxID=516935 RepID=A0ABV6H5E2_9PAST